MSKLKEDLVVTSSTYFTSVKEHGSLFYLILGLNMLDIFKVIHDGQLLDDEELSPSKHHGPSSV